MANDDRGELEVKAKDGKVYTFALSLAAGKAIETRLNEGTDQKVKFPEWIQNLDDMTKISLVWWASSRRHHPELTESDVDTLIDNAFKNVKEMMAAINRLINLTYPTDEDAKAAKLSKDGRPQKAQINARGTGGISTSSPNALA